MTITAPPAPRPTVPATRAERLLLPATFVTSLGNGIQLVAAAVLIFTTGHSTVSVGWLFIAASVPPALLSLFFGRVADRLDRRTLCLVADLTSALAALALPAWLLLGGEATRAAYLVTFVLAVISALFMPASNALIKERIAPERVGRFSAHFEIATQAGNLLAAAVGGFTIQLVGTAPLFVVNGATFLLSAAGMWLIGRAPAPVRAAAVSAPRAAVTGVPLLRVGLLYATCTVLTMVSNTLLVVLVYRGFHRGAGVYGLVDALAGIGFVTAAALYPRVAWRGHLPIAVVGILGCCALVAVEHLHVAVLLLGIPFAGALVGLARVATRSLLLTAVPESHAGRVFGATNAAGLGLSAGVTVLVAAVSDRVGISASFLVLAGLVAVTAAGTAASLRGRTLG
ncbi:putative MFS-type transporter YfiS [Longispora fulva]|uniref:MFS family permease n=1 Tax=Longispora fulva TaxID=619741 RepID=A0A8J7GR31_9ACTN|nr:MFS transporter [Longispora fulva]MBG6137249.1 MFS family permease [Longispora fulva]GIG61398.1 putative MFS-type transporter YfiS [Longispora fulva]